MSEKILSKEEIKQREVHFQELQDIYFANGDKPSWDLMWKYVNDACSNSAKKQLRGILTDDLEGKVTDATMLVMSKIKNGTRVNKLSSFVYWYVKGVLFNKKVAFEEQAWSYDLILSEMQEKNK